MSYHRTVCKPRAQRRLTRSTSAVTLRPTALTASARGTAPAARTVPRIDWTEPLGVRATMTGARFNPILRELYEPPRQAGKPPKLAFVVVARKLRTILNAIARERTAWQA